jgi:hypothetical protein
VAIKSFCYVPKLDERRLHNLLYIIKDVTT